MVAGKRAMQSAYFLSHQVRPDPANTDPGSKGDIRFSKFSLPVGQPGILEYVARHHLIIVDPNMH
jgi:hypothetical protein